MSAVENLLARLGGVKRRGPGRWQALCPAHKDTAPSLSIQEESDGRVLIHCHAGCAAHEVVAAVGLDMRALFPPKERRRRTTTHDDLDPVTIPRDVLTDPRFLALPPSAHKLLNVGILRNLSATNNGNLMLLTKKPRVYGFANWRTLSHARDALLDSGFLEVSRHGGHGRATLYGVTWLPLFARPNMCPLSTTGPSRLWVTKPMPAGGESASEKRAGHGAKTTHQTVRHGTKTAYQPPSDMVQKVATDMSTLKEGSFVDSSVDDSVVLGGSVPSAGVPAAPHGTTTWRDF
jgi:hypothetical protein